MTASFDLASLRATIWASLTSFALACSGGAPAESNTPRNGELPPVPEDGLVTVIDELPPPPPVAPGSPVGFLSGTFEVSDRGDARYELPLAVPPGRGGMTPTIAADYSSARGQGLMGLGWTIKVGMSKIERCGRTLADDGYARSVRYDDEDRLCLDGQRLVLVDGNGYWDAGAEYRTQRDSHRKIVHLPDGPGGPSFVAWTKTGEIHRYGTTPWCNGCGTTIWGDDHTTEGWLLAQREDRFGNSIDYAYNHSLNSRPTEATMGDETEAYRPATIWYTANRDHNRDATRRLDFVYSSRPDRQYGWKRGARRTSGWLLDRVEVRAAQTLLSSTPPLMTYEFGYESEAPSDRQRLASVEVCDDAGVCQQPTTFRYQNGTVGFEAPSLAGGNTPEIDAQWNYDPDVPYVLDANGDGRDDLVYPDDGWWRIRLANPDFGPGTGASPFLAEQNIEHPTANAVVRGAPLDLDGDGNGDLLLFEDAETQGRAPGLATWRVLVSNGDGSFTLEDTGAGYPRLPPGGGPSAGASEPLAGMWRSDHTIVIDFDGDGLDDLVSYDQDFASGNSEFWNVRLNDGAGGFDAPISLTAAGASEYPALKPIPVDLDGDGIEELMMPDACNCAYGWMTLENGTPVYRQSISLPLPSGAGGAMQLLNINGDALRDAIYYSGGLNPSMGILSNSGAGFRGLSGNTAVGHPATADWSTPWYLPLALGVDYNRDGIGDLLLPRSTPGTPGGASNWGALVANKGADYLQAGGIAGPTGPLAYFTSVDLPEIGFDAIGSCEGYSSDGSTSPPTHAYARPRTLDVDGDNMTDLLQVECGEFVVRRGAGVRNGLLTEVWEGRPPQPGPEQPSYAVEYSSASNDEVYTRGETCAYPQRCTVPGKELVSRVVIDSGTTSPQRSYQYRYEDWRVDLLGHGELGFLAMTVLDEISEQTARTEFTNHQRDPATNTYPLQGRVRSSVRTTPLVDGSVIEDSEQRYYHVRPTWPGVYVVGLSRSRVDRTEERDGITTTMHYANTEHAEPTWFGAVPWTRIETLTGDTYIDREIADNPAQWVVGVVAFRSSVATDLAGNTVIDEDSFTVDMTTGARIGSVANPNSPSDRATTVLTRNPLGLVQEVTVSNDAGVSRTFDLRYDDQDIFVVYTRNAEGDETHSRVDPARGTPLVHSDANGLVTTQQLDTFGEIVEVVYPTGRKVVRTRGFPAAGADHSWSVRTHSPGHGDRTDYYGRRGQLVATERVGLLGVQSRVEFSYDAHGRRIRTTTPHAPGTVASYATVHTLDRAGRLRRTDFPNATSRTLDYDGLSVTETDPRGVLTTRHHDTDGRVEAVIDANQQWTVYRYGPAGGLTHVHDPNGNDTLFMRDALGRKTTLLDPDLGERRFRYNAFGELDGTWSPEHGWRDHQLDGLGRVVSMNDADGTTSFDFGLYGFRGSLSRHESPDGVVVQLGYSPQTGLVDRWVLRLPGQAPLLMGASYDQYGRPDVLEYPAVNGKSFRVRYDYDSVGNIVGVRDASSGQLLWKATAADLRGQVTAEEFGNGVEGQRDYFDATGLLAAVSSRTPSATSDDVQHSVYGYDENGNLRFRFDQLQDGGAGLAETFRYDPLNRVRHVRLCSSAPVVPPTGVTEDDFDSGCQDTTEVQYDELGNIVHRNDRGDYTYGGVQPHAVTDVDGRAFDYDGNGNQIVRGQLVAEYTAFDLPRRFTDTSSGEEVSFTYDAFRQRTTKVTPNEQSDYFGRFYRRDDAPGAPFGHPNATHRYFVYAGDRVVAEVIEQGAAGQTVLYNHTDHLGTTEVRSDDGMSGSVQLERHSYDVFGQARDPDWNAQSPIGMGPHQSFGYTGHELDDALELVNMGGRIYDPEIGRFTTPDPRVQAPYVLQSLNRYSYVWNNPMSLIDPSGFQAEGPDAGDGIDPDAGYDDFDGLDREDIEFGDGEGSTIVVERSGEDQGPAAGSEEGDAGGGGADDNRDPPDDEEGPDPDRGHEPSWGTRFSTTFQSNFVQTNKFFFQGPTRFARSALGMLTAASVAETIGGVTTGRAVLGLLFPTAGSWTQVARGVIGLAPRGYAFAPGTTGITILRGAGIPARGVGVFGAGQTIARAVITSGANALLVAASLEGGIIVGSAIDAGLQASGVDLSTAAPAAWAAWSDFITVD